MTDLLTKLRAGGELEAVGRFTLDSKKAREKLRQYQLADPHRYVLLLVEAMTLAGAHKLDFSVDTDDVRLTCFCRPFSYEQLADIYASLFVDVDATLDERARGHLRGLQQLAYALNSAMALNPRFIRVESVDAEGHGVRLVLEPERPDQLERIEAGEPGTRIHVRDRLRPGLMVEFLRSLGSGVAEHKLLRKHCRWSSTVATVLDGKTISGPLEFDGETWFAEPILDKAGQMLGRAAIHCLPPGAGQPGPAYADLVFNGVWIERVSLERMVAGFAAIVTDAGLNRDVSQGQVLRDAVFEQVVEVLRASEAKLIQRLAERWIAAHEREQVGMPAWTEATLREWMGHQPAGRLASASAVAKVPLWRALGDRRLTSSDLHDHDPIHYCREPFSFAPSNVAFVLDLVDDGEYELFAKLFGRRGIDHGPALRAELERDVQRRQFLTRGHSERLPDGYYERREPIVGELDPTHRITGEIGLRSLGHRDSWVRLVREGCLLQEIRLAHPIPGLCGVIAAEFATNDDWDRAQLGEGLARAAFELLRALERMLRALAESGVVEPAAFDLQELVRAYIRATSDRQFVATFLAQFGFAESEARGLLRKLAPVGVSPDWQLHPADGASLHPLARVPLYKQAQGHPLALVELLAWRREGQRIAWLDHDIGPLPQLERSVLLLDAGDRTALRALFGDDAFERHHDRLAWLRQRETLLAQPKRPLGHAAPPLVTVGLVAQPGPVLRGELGLAEFVVRTDTLAGSAVARVRVSHSERPLPDVDLDLPLPGLVAWIDSEQLDLSSNFRELARIQDIRPTLVATLPELILRELERAERDVVQLRRCELWWLQRVLALVVGDEGLVRAWIDLRAAGRTLEWAELLGVLDQRSTRELERSLGRLRGRGELPTRAALESDLGRPSRSPSSSELELARVRIGVAGLLDRLLAVPLLRVIDGSRASSLPKVGFAALLDQLANQTTIAWVPEGFRIDRMPATTGPVLALDPIEQRICTMVVGAAALEDVSAWLAGRARFERRTRVDEIRLPSRQALVQITIADQSDQAVRGELGLARESPTQASRTRIRVFYLGREIATLDLPAEPLALVGALEFTTLELDPSHDNLAPAGRERVRSAVARHAETLLSALVEEFSQLVGAERSLAAELLRRVLVAWPPGSGGYAARAKRAPKRFAAFADLPIFPGARRPWTASELAEAAQRGSIATIDVRVDRPLPEGPVIVLERSDLLPTLDALFGRTRDLASEWAKQAEITRIKAAAPRLPEPPDDSLGLLALSGEGLAGHLWWSSAGASQIALGREGRCFGHRSAPESFPCAGVLAGTGLVMNSDWTRASLVRGQDQLIERGAHDLWTAMIDEFERLEADGSASTSARRARLRATLRGQFLRLHASGGKRSPTAGKSKRKPRTKPEAMVRRLWTLSILELADGHHVSPEIAVRERPAELAPLALWQGPSAEQIARATLDRKQAEQRRQAELEAARDEERERRRAEQDAQRVAAEHRRRREAAEREQAERQPAPAQPVPAKRELVAPAKPAKREGRGQPATPEQVLLDAICSELRLVRGKCEGLLANHHLEALTMVEGGRGPLFEHSPGNNTIRINANHPLVAAALQTMPEDPMQVTLLASTVYTFLNLVHTEITDENEAELLGRHALYAGSRE